MSVNHCYNDNDRGEPKYSEENLYCTSANWQEQVLQPWIWDWTLDSETLDRRLTTWRTELPNVALVCYPMESPFHIQRHTPACGLFFLECLSLYQKIHQTAWLQLYITWPALVIQVAVDLVFFPLSNLTFCVSILKQTHLIIAILMPN